jgi:hypothetical protein
MAAPAVAAMAARTAAPDAAMAAPAVAAMAAQARAGAIAQVPVLETPAAAAAVIVMAAIVARVRVDANHSGSVQFRLTKRLDIRSLHARLAGFFRQEYFCA